jgi:hypothetical protein
MGRCADGQIDTMKITVAFCNFANTPKNDIPSEIRGYITEHSQPKGIKPKTTQH